MKIGRDTKEQVQEQYWDPELDSSMSRVSL